MSSRTQAGGWVERAKLFHSLACEYAEEKDEERSAHWTAVHHAQLVEQAALTERLAEALTLLLNDKGPDFIKSSSWHAARIALAAYKESQA